MHPLTPEELERWIESAYDKNKYDSVKGLSYDVFIEVLELAKIGAAIANQVEEQDPDWIKLFGLKCLHFFKKHSEIVKFGILSIDPDGEASLELDIILKSIPRNYT